MNWKPVYALLLLSSTVITYLAAIGMERYSNSRKRFLVGGLAINLLILFFFKYYNWAGENLAALFNLWGISIAIPKFNVLLPVGISFYIFQALGYSIDVYRKDLPAERNFFRYALFVSFFPQLVAGPVERSTNLLQQFKQKTELSYDNFWKGLNMMLWGYFFKLAIADRCAIYVDSIFNNADYHTGGSFALASTMFCFNIYGDFAGYSLIAIGVAKIMGYSLMQNFNHPYFFATSVQDYWKRNHISLTTWFMDYVYYPMIGNSRSLFWWCFCMFFTFFLSGFWHGANWTYVFCFSVYGLLLVWETLTQKKKKMWEKRHNLKNNTLYHVLQRITTFVIVAFLAIFFRANSIEDAFHAIKEILTDFGMPFLEQGKRSILLSAICIFILFIKEYSEEYNKNWHLSQSKSWVIRHLYTTLMILFIILFGVLNGGQFIYFQF